MLLGFLIDMGLKVSLEERSKTPMLVMAPFLALSLFLNYRFPRPNLAIA
jgi:hypothetical protein